MSPNIFVRPAPGSSHPDRMMIEMAISLHHKGMLAEAELLYREILQSHNGSAMILSMLATLRLQLGDAHAAVEFFQRGLMIDTLQPEAWNNLGVALKCLGRLEEALAAHQEAIRLAPEYLEAISNRCAVLGDLQRLEEALEDADWLLQKCPDAPALHNNRGVILQDMGRHEDALAAFAAAQALAPDYADAHWNEARCRLLVGDYERGWEKYEWRWKRPEFAAAKRDLAQPLWTGDESLLGKTILAYSEQGLGDIIQFVRYAQVLAERGARVVLEVPAALKSLLALTPGVEQIVGVGEALPVFDYQVPLMSLPYAVGTTLDSVPKAGAYVHAAPAKVRQWRERLGSTEPSRPLIRVGVMWAGNPAQKDNHLRSASLQEMLLAFSMPGVVLYSLQKELSQEEQAIVASGAVCHFGDSMEETAALMANMDLVVSVCTSMAHLAGAMNLPVWVLLHESNDWRWLRNRDDSPWYASARLFRQERAGDWSGVFARAKTALLDLIKAGESA